MVGSNLLSSVVVIPWPQHEAARSLLLSSSWFNRVSCSTAKPTPLRGFVIRLAAVPLLAGCAMPKTVYFDSNAFCDVFEARDPTLFPELRAMCASGTVDVVVSEINLVELLAGHHRATSAAALQRLLSVAPKWILLTGLAGREIADEYDGSGKRDVLAPVGALVNWSTLLPWIVEARDQIPGHRDPDRIRSPERFFRRIDP